MMSRYSAFSLCSKARRSSAKLLRPAEIESWMFDSVLASQAVLWFLFALLGQLAHGGTSKKAMCSAL